MKTAITTFVALFITLAVNAQSSGDLAMASVSYGDKYSENKTDNAVVVAEMLDPNTFLETGKSLESQNDFQGALAELDKALLLNENFAPAHDLKSIVYIKLGRFQKALREANDAIKLDSKLSSAYNHRGIVYYYQANYTQALNDYTRAISLNPEYGNAYFNRALARISVDDEKGAYDDLIRARKLHCQGVDEVLKDLFPDKQ